MLEPPVWKILQLANMFVLKTSRDSKLVVNGSHLYLIDEVEQMCLFVKFFEYGKVCMFCHLC